MKNYEQYKGRSSKLKDTVPLSIVKFGKTKLELSLAVWNDGWEDRQTVYDIIHPVFETYKKITIQSLTGIRKNNIKLLELTNNNIMVYLLSWFHHGK
jgi:hypothetical protein